MNHDRRGCFIGTLFIKTPVFLEEVHYSTSTNLKIPPGDVREKENTQPKPLPLPLPKMANSDDPQYMMNRAKMEIVMAVLKKADGKATFNDLFEESERQQ
jgi:hypothetical protein